MSTRMPRGLLREIRQRVSQGNVILSVKAQAEMDDLGLETADVFEVLAALEPSDFDHVLTSIHGGEPMFVFKPTMVHLVLYVKVVLRFECVVVSFHEDEDEAEEQADD